MFSFKTTLIESSRIPTKESRVTRYDPGELLACHLPVAAFMPLLEKLQIFPHFQSSS